MTNHHYFCVTCVILTFQVLKVSSSYLMVVQNSGPAVLDSNITFSITIIDYKTEQDLIYSLDDGTRKTEYKTKTGSLNVTLNFPQDVYDNGLYFMNITVLSDGLIFDKTVARNSTEFELRNTLIGNVNLFRGNETSALTIDEVAVGENISLVVDLVDKNGYLKNAVLDYGWSIDFERHYSLGNTLVYNFSSTGYKDIKAIVTATFPNNDFKVGTFEKVINAKVPVHGVNVSGNPFLYHGDKLNLNISCNGTPPFVYCFKIFNTSISPDNFTCTHLSSFSNCHMEILKYLQNDGKYNIGIYISNNVKEIKRVIEVMVYSVTVKPTLSTVIIPIICSLMALMILAVGISFCITQRNQLAVEVANFDFQDESDSYTERTFFENILDNFTCRNCRQASCKAHTESDPLIESI